MKKALVSVFTLFIMVGSAGAQQKVERLSVAEVAAMWSHIGATSVSSASIADGPTVSKNGGIDLSQATAAIEVIPLDQYGRSFNIAFRSISGVPGGTAVAFRISLPNGSVLDLGGVVKNWDDDGMLYYELWNGLFPGVWPGGSTLFEAIMIVPGTGISYVSAPADVWCRGCSYDRLIRADVSSDGSSIAVQGSFSGTIFATLDGIPANVVVLPEISPSPFVPSIGTPARTVILTDKVGWGQMNLTVCASGRCSSRFVYLPNRPNQRVGGGKG